MVGVHCRGWSRRVRLIDRLTGPDPLVGGWGPAMFAASRQWIFWDTFGLMPHRRSVLVSDSDAALGVAPISIVAGWQGMQR